MNLINASFPAKNKPDRAFQLTEWNTRSGFHFGFLDIFYLVILC